MARGDNYLDTRRIGVGRAMRMGGPVGPSRSRARSPSTTPDGAATAARWPPRRLCVPRVVVVPVRRFPVRGSEPFDLVEQDGRSGGTAPAWCDLRRP